MSEPQGRRQPEGLVARSPRGEDKGERGRRERDRLRALGLWEETRDVQLACRTFGGSRAPLYRWRQRVDRRDLASLKERSRRPRRGRTPRGPLKLITDVQQVRRTYPRWGKDTWVLLLRAQGHATSASTVGRILTYLKTHGRLVEPKRRTVGAAKRRLQRRYATRKPQEYHARRPGALVQLDPLDSRPLPGGSLTQFTARDVVSRWDVGEAHSRATAPLATQCLEPLPQRMPFPIRGLPGDGGAEFYAAFEAACRQRGSRLFVLPPKSPKLNGAVERAQRTYTEEFYEVTECAWTIDQLNQELVQGESIDNTGRPHQALGYLTPLQFLKQHGIIPNNTPSLSHV